MIVSPRTASPLRLEHESVSNDRAWRAKGSEFGHEVVLPLAQLIDRLGVLAARASGLPLREFLVQARDEGFTRLCDSSERGGTGLSRAGEYMVIEELATADAGLAALLIAAPVPFRWARAAPRRCLREMSSRYLEGERLDWSGCWTADPYPTLRATPSDRGWLLGGRTRSLLGAAVATHAALGCRLEIGGSHRAALAIVELERTGITRRPESEQLGLRAGCRAELLLQGVFVSGEELLFTGPPGVGWLAGATALDQLIGAISAVGIARAGYKAALRFAREQPYAGATTRERRQADRLLPRLRSRLCLARRSTAAAHLRRGLSGSPDEPGALEQATVARVLATEVALEIVGAASEICLRRTNSHGEVEFLDGSTVWLEKLRRDAGSLDDPVAGFARAAREPHPATPRSVEWTRRSSLASG
jgi:alkylation response protein AidB-like acyl-CoA dehydrogenase